jgi:hypothetical protein
MTEERRKPRIRLELTKRQKEQIRKATGREVTALELRLEALPEPAGPITPEEAAGGEEKDMR